MFADAAWGRAVRRATSAHGGLRLLLPAAPLLLFAAFAAAAPFAGPSSPWTVPSQARSFAASPLPALLLPERPDGLPIPVSRYFFAVLFGTNRKKRYICSRFTKSKSYMVDVAQLVRASDCGSEGRGFEPLLPPLVESRPAGRLFFVCCATAPSRIPPYKKRPEPYRSGAFERMVGASVTASRRPSRPNVRAASRGTTRGSGTDGGSCCP